MRNSEAASGISSILNAIGTMRKDRRMNDELESIMGVIGQGDLKQAQAAMTSATGEFSSNSQLTTQTNDAFNRQFPAMTEVIVYDQETGEKRAMMADPRKDLTMQAQRKFGSTFTSQEVIAQAIRMSNGELNTPSTDEAQIQIALSVIQRSDPGARILTGPALDAEFKIQGLQNDARRAANVGAKGSKPSQDELNTNAMIAQINADDPLSTPGGARSQLKSRELINNELAKKLGVLNADGSVSITETNSQNAYTSGLLTMRDLMNRGAPLNRATDVADIEYQLKMGSLDLTEFQEGLQESGVLKGTIEVAKATFQERVGLSIAEWRDIEAQMPTERVPAYGVGPRGVQTRVLPIPLKTGIYKGKVIEVVKVNGKVIPIRIR